MQPDDPMVPVLEEVAREAASVREMGERLERQVAEIAVKLQAADVGKAAAGAVRYELSALHKAHLLRTGVLGAALLLAACGIGLGVGFALGHSHGAVAGLTARCQGTALREVGGRMACSFWVHEPPASGKAGAGR